MHFPAHATLHKLNDHHALYVERPVKEHFNLREVRDKRLIALKRWNDLKDSIQFERFINNQSNQYIFLLISKTVLEMVLKVRQWVLGMRPKMRLLKSRHSILKQLGRDCRVEKKNLKQ